MSLDRLRALTIRLPRARAGVAAFLGRLGDARFWLLVPLPSAVMLERLSRGATAGGIALILIAVIPFATLAGATLGPVVAWTTLVGAGLLGGAALHLQILTRRLARRRAQNQALTAALAVWLETSSRSDEDGAAERWHR